MSDLIKKHACSTMTRKFIFMAACAMCDASITDYSLFFYSNKKNHFSSLYEREYVKKDSLKAADGVIFSYFSLRQI